MIFKYSLEQTRANKKYDYIIKLCFNYLKKFVKYFSILNICNHLKNAVINLFIKNTVSRKNEGNIFLKIRRGK